MPDGPCLRRAKITVGVALLVLAAAGSTHGYSVLSQQALIDFGMGCCPQASDSVSISDLQEGVDEGRPRNRRVEDHRSCREW